MITDDLAQASVENLPVMGAIRAQLIPEIQPVRSPDGSIVQASDASPLWSGDGPAPRLFEQINIQRYEVAQNDVESQSQSGSSVGQVTSAAAGGLSLAGISLVSGVLGAEPEESADPAETSPAPASSAPPLPPPPPATSEYLSNTDFQALTAPRSYTGSSVEASLGTVQHQRPLGAHSQARPWRPLTCQPVVTTICWQPSQRAQALAVYLNIPAVLETIR